MINLGLYNTQSSALLTHTKTLKASTNTLTASKSTHGSRDTLLASKSTLTGHGLYNTLTASLGIILASLLMLSIFFPDSGQVEILVLR